MALVAGIIGTVGAIYGADQTGEAADEQADAARRAGALTERQFERTRSDLAPYRTTGDLASGRISRVLGLGGAAPDLGEFYADPGYQFRLAEGNRALDRSGAARGTLLSGAQIKAAQRYNQGLASQEFGNFFNRLYSLSSQGLNAAAQTGQFGANAAANQANYGLAAGNATALGRLGQADLVLGGLGQLTGAYGQYQENKRGQSGYGGESLGYAPPPQQSNLAYGGYV